MGVEGAPGVPLGTDGRATVAVSGAVVGECGTPLWVATIVGLAFRMYDPDKMLGDKKFTPYMIGQRSRVVLQVPVMDKVGTLRQATTPQAGQEYWMVFSNKGNYVRPGDRVNVVIGAFHADGLLVD